MDQHKPINRARALLSLLVLLGITACHKSGLRELNQGISLAAEKKFSEALVFFDRAIQRDQENEIGVQSMREAAKISFYELKDFKKALQYYYHLVRVSPQADERLQSQKQIATIFFNHLNEYKQAVTEINKLLSMSFSESEKINFRMNLSRAYYYLNNFSQADSEVDEILKLNLSNDEKFEMFVLKGNIYLAKKELSKAAEVFKTLVKQNPERATRDNVALTLAVAYEEMTDYKSAIEILEGMKPYHPMPDYIDVRIKRLTERKKNQPGARGIRK